MQKNNVTIIIPNYNGAEDVIACLDALRTQTYPAGVIVVDDGSTDNSVEAVEAYIAEKTGSDNADAIRSLTLIQHTENRGFAAAVNTGIRRAETPYVILLNNDAFAERTFTEALVRAIRRRKKTFAVQAMMLQADSGDGPVRGDTGKAAGGRRRVDSCGDFFCALGWAFSPGRDRDAGAYTRPVRITSACAGAAIYDRMLLKKNGLFDEAHFCYLEDVDIGLRAFRAGYSSFLAPDAVVRHKGSASSGSRYNAFKTRMTTANSLYTAYKNMPGWMLVLYAPLLVCGTLIKGVFYARKGFGKEWRRGLSEGKQKIMRYREAGRIPAVPSSPRRDALLAFELLGNCVRRLRG